LPLLSAGTTSTGYCARFGDDETEQTETDGELPWLLLCARRLLFAPLKGIKTDSFSLTSSNGGPMLDGTSSASASDAVLVLEEGSSRMWTSSSSLTYARRARERDSRPSCDGPSPLPDELGSVRSEIG